METDDEIEVRLSISCASVVTVKMKRSEFAEMAERVDAGDSIEVMELPSSVDQDDVLNQLDAYIDDVEEVKPQRAGKVRSR